MLCSVRWHREPRAAIRRRLIARPHQERFVGEGGRTPSLCLHEAFVVESSRHVGDDIVWNCSLCGLEHWHAITRTHIYKCAICTLAPWKGYISVSAACQSSDWSDPSSWGLSNTVNLAASAASRLHNPFRVTAHIQLGHLAQGQILMIMCTASVAAHTPSLRSWFLRVFFCRPGMKATEKSFWIRGPEAAFQSYQQKIIKLDSHDANKALSPQARQAITKSFLLCLRPDLLGKWQ